MAIGTKIGSAYFEVLASTIGFGDSLEAGVTNAITARAFVLGDAMERLGKALFFRFTLPFAVGASANLAQFAKLERGVAETLTLFNTAPSLINRTFGAMTKGIRGVSEEVGGLESAIADGLYQTISAGVPRGDAFEFLNVAQMAATADKTADLTEAVDGLTTIINAYSLSSEDALKISDAMFAAVARGKTTFGELGQDIGRVAPLAANAGATFQETLAIISQLTVGGLKTSESISFLRAAITGLLRPGDEMNEIFERIGFKSAEAAVPVLGLQGAFQAVVEAAGGSTSRLQELIGTSEGVTAVLGVTGDKAMAFASVLDSIENSAGRTVSAFDIVEGTVSRSFGRMTEAFDRLGNLFGGLGAQFAQPVVDFVTGVINEIIDVFDELAPYIETVAGGFARFIGQLNAPVIRTIAGVLASIVISFGGMLAIIGGVLIPLGLFIKGIAFAVTALHLLGPATKVLGVMTKGVHALGAGMVALAGKITGTNIAASTASQTLSFFGKTFSITLRQVVAFSVGMIAVAVAVAAAVVIAKEWSEVLGDIDDEMLITTVGVDRLAESLGIVLDPLGRIAETAEADHDLNFEFVLANAPLLENVQLTLDRLGETAAKDQVIRIAYELSSRGASVDEVEKFIERISSVTELDIDISDVFSQLDSGEAAFTGLNAQLDLAISLLPDVRDGFESLQAVHGALLPDVRMTQQAYADLADFLVQIRIEEGPEAFVKAMAAVQSSIEGTSVEDFFVDEILKSFNDAADGATNFSTKNTATFAQLPAELARGIPFYSELATNIDAVTEAAEAAAGPLKDMTGGLPSDIEAFGITTSKVLEGVITLTQQQSSTLQQVRGDIGSVLQAGEDVILSTFTTIREGMLAQMPLLDTYKGAVKQSFASWKKGQNLFQADIEAVASLRDNIKDRIAPEILGAFDKLSLDKKAWLANLGEKNLETALVELGESFDAANQAAADTFEQDIPDTLQRANEAMQTKFDELEAIAGASGRGVAKLFNIWFERRSKLWEDTASTAMANIATILGKTIAGPTVGPVTFTDGGFEPVPPPTGPGVAGTDIDVHIYNANTSNLVRDSEKAAGIIRTSSRLPAGAG